MESTETGSLEHDEELRFALRRVAVVTALAVILFRLAFLLKLACSGVEMTPREALARRERERQNRELLRRGRSGGGSGGERARSGAARRRLPRTPVASRARDTLLGEIHGRAQDTIR